jgi:hypothetical protein
MTYALGTVMGGNRGEGAVPRTAPKPANGTPAAPTWPRTVSRRGQAHFGPSGSVPDFSPRRDRGNQRILEAPDPLELGPFE